MDSDVIKPSATPNAGPNLGEADQVSILKIAREDVRVAKLPRKPGKQLERRRA
jgi:hypothetical protein